MLTLACSRVLPSQLKRCLVPVEAEPDCWLPLVVGSSRRGLSRLVSYADVSINQDAG